MDKKDELVPLPEIDADEMEKHWKKHIMPLQASVQPLSDNYMDSREGNPDWKKDSNGDYWFIGVKASGVEYRAHLRKERNAKPEPIRKAQKPGISLYDSALNPYAGKSNLSAKELEEDMNFLKKVFPLPFNSREDGISRQGDTNVD